MYGTKSFVNQIGRCWESVHQNKRIHPYGVKPLGKLYTRNIMVKNLSPHPQKDYIVEIPIEKLSLSLANYIIVTEKGEELPIDVYKRQVLLHALA